MRNRYLLLWCVVIIGISLLFAGCSSAVPAPAPTTGASAKPAAAAPAAAAPGAAASKTDALAGIIAGAKKEGTALTALTASYTTPEMLSALSAAIKAKYGVELNIKATGTENMGAMVTQAAMEQKTGAKPTYDLQTLGSDYVPQAFDTGAFEKVDWKPLMPEGTADTVVPQRPEMFGVVSYYSDMTGLQYNPNKITSAEVPKKIADLADPKWKGRLAIMDYPNYWARWAHVLGVQETESNLQKIISTNKPMIQLMPAMNNSYTMGEVDMTFSSNSYFRQTRDKGVPIAFQPLDFIEIRSYDLLVRKNAEHPNAAKLIAIFLASPDGYKFSRDVVKKGSLDYPGNEVNDAVQAAQKAGIPVWGLENHPTMLQFILSPDYDKVQAEFKKILDGGKK